MLLAAPLLAACCLAAAGVAASGGGGSPWVDTTLAFAASRIAATLQRFPAGDRSQPDAWRFPSRTTSKADGQWTQVGLWGGGGELACGAAKAACATRN